MTGADARAIKNIAIIPVVRKGNLRNLLRGRVSNLLGRMQQGDLEPSSLMLASYWSSRFENERKKTDEGTKRDISLSLTILTRPKG